MLFSRKSSARIQTIDTSMVWLNSLPNETKQQNNDHRSKYMYFHSHLCFYHMKNTCRPLGSEWMIEIENYNDKSLPIVTLHTCRWLFGAFEIFEAYWQTQPQLTTINWDKTITIINNLLHKSITSDILLQTEVSLSTDKAMTIWSLRFCIFSHAC